MRRLPASDTRALPEDRTRPVSDAIPLARATAGDDRGSRPTELAADDRPRAIVPLEKRPSQPAPTPCLQDRLSQPVPPAVPARVDIGSAPSLEERLSSDPDLSLAVMLYDQLNKLPSPFVAASRLRLAGIVFPVTELVRTSESHGGSDLHVYRATTATFGAVEIKTTDDLSGTEDFVLIHPWISPLLDQGFSRRAAGIDDPTLALRLVARLMQPFGALLLTPLSRVQYKRVATDSLIMVRVGEETSLNALIDGICTIDIQ